MKTVIYYFTGTGNSLQVAKDIAEELGDTKLISIAKGKIEKSDRTGIVFPIHGWGVPLIVTNFLKKLTPNNYTFAVATCSGCVAAALPKVKKLLKKKLSSGFKLRMPNNYLVMGRVDKIENQEKKFTQEKKRVKEICKAINEKKKIIETDLFLVNILLTGVINKLMQKIQKTADKNFIVTDKCNGCGTCAKVCPVNNIDFDKRPKWKHNCEGCFACLHWCPQEAIEFGKKTVGKQRYHHPDIKLSEMIK